MGQLRETEIVKCPLSQAHRLLEMFFRQNVERSPNLDAQHAVCLRLRVPATLPVDEPELYVERDVICTLMPAPAPNFVAERIAVEWTPVSGPYPSFSGTLSIAADEDYAHFRLMLSGTYRPPGGVFGQAFDAVIGKRLASLTARDLLGRIRDSIEAGHERIEKEKLAHNKEFTSTA